MSNCIKRVIDEYSTLDYHEWRLITLTNNMGTKDTVWYCIFCRTIEKAKL